VEWVDSLAEIDSEFGLNLSLHLANDGNVLAEVVVPVEVEVSGLELVVGDRRLFCFYSSPFHYPLLH